MSMLLTILGALMVVFIFGIVTFRIIKYKFNKLNKENTGLLVSAVLIATICETPAHLYYFIAFVAVILLLIIIAGMVAKVTER